MEGQHNEKKPTESPERTDGAFWSKAVKEIQSKPIELDRSTTMGYSRNRTRMMMSAENSIKVLFLESRKYSSVIFFFIKF